jgi:hypothetical protein
MENDIATDWIDINTVVDKIEVESEYNGFEAIDGFSEPFEYESFGEEQPYV